MREKIHIQKYGGQKTKIKIRYLVMMLALCFSASIPKINANAENCQSLRIVFARGSGGERWNDQNYLTFKSTLETKLKTVSLDYEFIDLDYPAVSVGINNLEVALGALIGSGDVYTFGESVNTGVRNLQKVVNNSCPNTKYVLGGYSQGAMVISKSLSKLNPDKIIYAATFGDPKIYLPEGKGIVPPACSGENLSDYRVYVPDCQAYKGLLGAYIPYEPENYIGKLGTWCNKRDIFCSSRFNISDHTAYVSNNIYDDASMKIFAKITHHFGLENHVSSLHDTAFLIDSTGSMNGMIDKYKAEAYRLAKETLDTGGRIALFDYRDLDDPYTPLEYCNFENCTLEAFESGLSRIVIDGGGDNKESLLSASSFVMRTLNWQLGSTKSLVVLTDDGFLQPDRDGIRIGDVIQLSKNIDPVNFYIITDSDTKDLYTELAEKTGGKVVDIENESLSFLTDYIIEKNDGLPRVEMGKPFTADPIKSIETEEVKDDTLKIKIENPDQETMVIINDTILGITKETEITISELDRCKENTISLVPIYTGYAYYNIRGESTDIHLEKNEQCKAEMKLKAPKTGQN